MKKRFISLILLSIISFSSISCTKSNSLKDGNYEIESSTADERGYKCNLTFEVKDGKITEALYDEFKESDNSKKRDDIAYNEKMKSVSGISMSDACTSLEKALIDKQEADIDIVSGATGSTNNFKQLATKGLENAKEGKTEKSLIDIK